MKNATFGNGANGSFNACVGNNGWQDITTYGDGYDEAVKVMVKSTLERKVSIDAIIHPMIFTARHRIELFLKSAIAKIGECRPELIIENDKLIKTHDLEKLWNLFVEKAEKCDSRFDSFISKSREIILDFAEIDPTGETFRYPYSQDDKKHLVKTSVINVIVFYERYKTLSEEMENLGYLLEALIREYQQKTYTKELSREQIREISLKLPARETWGSEEFNNQKERIKKEFSLGNRKFSDTLKIIEKHREFASNVGIEHRIISITPEKLQKLLAYINELLLLKEIANELYRTGLFVPYSKNFSSVHYKLMKSIKEGFSKEEIATFASFLEHGRLDYYSEEFDLIFNRYKKFPLDEHVSEITSNRNIFRYVKKSLTYLGQITLLDCTKQYA